MENTKKLELTLCGMLPYKLQLHTIYVFRPNNKERPLIKGAKATLTGDLYADIENKTFGENPFKPLLHSLDKLTEPILEGGLIPIVELFKIAFPDCEKFSLSERKTIVRKHLVGYLDFEYDKERNGFKSIHYNDKIQVVGCFVVPNQLELFEKLKEYHFNIYDLPKDMYIEKSEVKQ